MADIVLINPRFEVSYWGMEYALPFLGKRANCRWLACRCWLRLRQPSTPSRSWTKTSSRSTGSGAQRADIVGITGMSVQRFRMKEILTELKQRGCFCVVGGPVDHRPGRLFRRPGRRDLHRRGRGYLAAVLDEWQHGLHQYRYEQLEKTDMTKVPTPRFDLLKMKHYAFGSLQFSRGCPFQCEFCDIIVTFGRRPRIKTSKQVIAELEAIYASGHRPRLHR